MSLNEQWVIVLADKPRSDTIYQVLPLRTTRRKAQTMSPYIIALKVLHILFRLL